MSLCQKHYKSIEAYCAQDHELLCINCILHDGHKCHSFNSIQDSVKIEFDFFNSNQEIFEKNQTQYIVKLDLLTQFEEKLSQECEKQMIEVTTFFNELKKIITLREQHIKQNVTRYSNLLLHQIQAIFLKKNQIAKSLQKNLQEQLQAFDIYFLELTNLKQGNNEIEFLKNSEKRHLIVENAQKTISIPDFSSKFDDLNKESEVNLIIKQLLAMKLGSIPQQQQQQQQQHQSSFNQKNKKRQIGNSCHDNQKKTSNRQHKKPLVQLIKLQSLQTDSINQQTVQISLSKKENLKPKVKLTNYQEARKIQKEKNQEKSIEKKQESYEKIPTPKQIEQEQYEQFGLKDDSMKQDFKTFLHSVSDSCISRQDISHIYTQWNYQFLTIGGFVDSGKQTIEKYDPKEDMSEDFDQMKFNRAKFGLAQLINGNYLIMGGKQDGVRVNSCQEYNVKDKVMMNSNVILNSSRSGFGIVTMNELIYIIGGNDGQSKILF